MCLTIANYLGEFRSDYYELTRKALKKIWGIRQDFNCLSVSLRASDNFWLVSLIGFESYAKKVKSNEFSLQFHYGNRHLL